MLSLLRGFALGTLLVGLGLLALPHQVDAQAKKDDKDKKDAKSFKGKVVLDESVQKKITGFPTSDGLMLRGYWFPTTTSKDNDGGDTVLMFPAPGNKVNDNWIALAKTLNDQGFAVLLFDWRGIGLNGPDRNIRIFDDENAFWNDPFNKNYAPKIAKTAGLDYAKQFAQTRYRDFIMNDLAAARFFLDKENDSNKCNTNRIWVVSEGQGAHIGMSFIASESYRFSIFKDNNLVAMQEPRKAVRDYVGFVALSYSGTNTTAASTYSVSFVNKASSVDGRDGRTHVENRMAMLMIYGKKEGPQASKYIVNQFVTGTDDQLKIRFKYLRELDNSKANKPVAGGDLLNEEDTYGARDLIVKAMLDISKDKQDGNKGTTTRNAKQYTIPPRFPIEIYKPR